MYSDKTIKSLNLSEEQETKLRELHQKEKILRDALKRCKVRECALEKIISKSDLNLIDADNMEALEEDIKTTWKDFIY